MTQAVTITLLDGKATPVAHEFEPVSRDANGVTTFLTTAAVAAGREVLSVQTRTSQTRRKVELRFAIPVIANLAESGQPDQYSRLRVNRASVVFDFDENTTNGSTLSEREDLVALVRNALASAQTELTEVIVDGTNFL